jgi:glycyl-tRNA synthetase
MAFYLWEVVEVKVAVVWETRLYVIIICDIHTPCRANQSTNLTKQALLNTSKRQEISELVDVQLSRDEDSVTSLAIAASKDESILALAGINSSQAEQLKGNNQHLRSFRLEFPLRKKEDDTATTNTEKTDGRKTTPLTQVSLFSSNVADKGKKPAGKVDTYQRLLRLSPYKAPELPRIGAIATGLAPVGEIVLFNATSHPQTSDVIGRIRLGNGEEAEDIDIIELEDGKFLVAYTDGTDVCTFEISSSRRSNTAPEIKTVFTIPKTLPKRSKYRALRFLSPTAILLLQNTIDRTGSELSVLSIPAKGNGTIVRRKRLRKSIKIGLSLDVVNFGEGQNHERQYFIALAGSDQSIETLILDYLPSKGYGSLQVYSTLKDVHPFSMTKVCFSHYRPPSYPVTANTPPQYVKLASISLGNTVVVHTFPLSPQRTLAGRETSSPRYALKAPGHSETLDTVFATTIALLVLAISCFVLQAFTEIRGLTPSYLGATAWLPDRIRDSIARPYLRDIIAADTVAPQVATTASSTAATISTSKPSIITGHHLRDLLHARKTSRREIQLEEDASSIIDTIIDSLETPTPSPLLIIKHNPEEDSIYAHHHYHDQDQDSTADDDESSSSSPSIEEEHQVRKWEDLQPEQRERWRRHLSEAGHWALGEGDQVLRGVFFGEIGGIIAAAAAGG